MACCGRKKPRRTKGASGKINRSSLNKNKRSKKVANERQQNNTQSEQ